MELETVGFNTIELSAYYRERGLYPEQVDNWRKASHDANESPVLSFREQKELENLGAQDQREMKQLIQKLRHIEKALAEAAVLLVLRKKWDAYSTGDACGYCSDDADG